MYVLDLKNLNQQYYRKEIENIESAKYLFFVKCAKKKLLNIFLNFFFYLKAQSFRLHT